MISAWDGEIIAVDEDASTFTFSADGAGFLLLGIKGAVCGFGTIDDIPIGSPQFMDEIDEMIVIRHPSQLSLKLFTLKGKANLAAV